MVFARQRQVAIHPACRRGQRSSAFSTSNASLSSQAASVFVISGGGARLIRQYRSCQLGHHYRDYNKRANRLVNIDMDICASVQEHGPSDRRAVTEIAVFLDNTVKHWLETSQAEQPEL